MKRYKKIVLEAERGINFEFSDGTKGEVIIRAVNINKTIDYSQKYANSPIPKGYNHVCGEWYNGFVIERDSDGSQFVWIPVGYLDSNGTLDGISFSEKFGRRNYLNNEFSKTEFHETFTDELALQVESVKKYGGFYISRYYISKNKETGKPQSVKGVMPWVNIKYGDAMKVAATIEDNEKLKSHLTFGAEYDSIYEWFIKSGTEISGEFEVDFTDCYNICDFQKRIVETGSSEKMCTNNIYDFATNVHEWTQEQNGNYYRVIRYGCYNFKEDMYKQYPRRFFYLPNGNCNNVGFRAALYID